MYNRPEDHVTYLQDCLKTLQDERRDEPVAWNRFIVASKPLPPISPECNNGYHSSSRQAGFSSDVQPGNTHAPGAYVVFLQQYTGYHSTTLLLSLYL